MKRLVENGRANGVGLKDRLWHLSEEPIGAEKVRSLAISERAGRVLEPTRSTQSGLDTSSTSAPFP
jgi:hypothetical protein